MACSALVSPANGYCALCKEAQKRSPLPNEEFARTFQPVRRIARVGEPRPACSLTRDGQRCVRESLCKGLCSNHYAQFNGYARRHGLARWRAVATPFTQVASCLVPTCELSALYSHGLCRHHIPKFRSYQRTEPAASMYDWAERQLPYLAAHQFTLVCLPQPLRQEVLYGLQQADPWLRIFEPCQVRRLVRDLASTPTLTADVPDGTICPHSSVAVLRLLNRVRTAVKASFAQHCGTAPAAHEILDLRALGQRARTPAGIRHPKTVDLRTIRQGWLRETLHTWTPQQRPDADAFARTLRAVELASRALARRPGTDDPSALRYDDVTAIVDAFRTAPKLDGQPAGWNYRLSFASHFFALIDYGRRSGTAPTLSAAFVMVCGGVSVAHRHLGVTGVGSVTWGLALTDGAHLLLTQVTKGHVIPAQTAMTGARFVLVKRASGRCRPQWHVVLPRPACVRDRQKIQRGGPGDGPWRAAPDVEVSFYAYALLVSASGPDSWRPAGRRQREEPMVKVAAVQGSLRSRGECRSARRFPRGRQTTGDGRRHVGGRCR
jgi:hypothetical protein